MVSAHYPAIYHRAFIFAMLIGLDGDMTRIDFELIRSDIRVRRITFVKKIVSPHYCESILCRGAEISLFEDHGHICGYLTSLIALPTKLKKIQN